MSEAPLTIPLLPCQDLGWQTGKLANLQIIKTGPLTVSIFQIIRDLSWQMQDTDIRDSVAGLIVKSVLNVRYLHNYLSVPLPHFNQFWVNFISPPWGLRLFCETKLLSRPALTSFLTHCLDCMVSCVLSWLHCAGKKNRGQSAWSGVVTQSEGSAGRQSMNRMGTGTVGQQSKYFKQSCKMSRISSFAGHNFFPIRQL